MGLEADKEVYARLRASLARARERGECFEDAWWPAVKEATHKLPSHRLQPLRHALMHTRGAWGLAFEGLPDVRAERMLAV